MAAIRDEEIERVVSLPDPNDKSRPKPVDVLLVGGPMDGQKVQCPVEATHVSYWVYKKPTLKSPRPEEFNTEATVQVRYQIHPMIGNSTTWYIGRLVGTSFDAAVSTIMESYHARTVLPNKRETGVQVGQQRQVLHIQSE